MELGYRLLRAWWRRGLASEGSLDLLRYGFDEVGLKRIFAQTLTVNEGSRAVMASVGMTYVHTLPADPEVPGSEHGEVVGVGSLLNRHPPWPCSNISAAAAPGLATG